MSFFGSMMGSIAGRAALPLMGVAGFGAYKAGAMDGMNVPGLPMMSAPSHYEMQARIVSVEDACRLRYRVEGKLRQTEALDCARAIDMLQQPDFVDYTLHKSERVEYSYYAMDGQSTLTGTLNSRKDAQGRPYRRNDVITIRIDADDPAKSEVI